MTLLDQIEDIKVTTQSITDEQVDTWFRHVASIIKSFANDVPHIGMAMQILRNYRMYEHIAAIANKNIEELKKLNDDFSSVMGAFSTGDYGIYLLTDRVYGLPLPDLNLLPKNPH